MGAEPAGSAAALARLNAAIGELKVLSAAPLVRRAAAALNAGDPEEGARWAIKALEKDETSGVAWYVLAFARERSGDFGSSIKCYEKALELLPDHAQIANDLGRLAMRMGMREQAEKLYLHFIQRNPENVEGYNNLVSALREQGRYDEAIEILKATLEKHPTSALLWNSLGTVMTELGDMPTALIFYDEALKLQPEFPKARYNRAATLLAMGDTEGALAACDAALAGDVAEDDRQMMLLARSTMLIELGRIGEGWDHYEVRLRRQYDDSTVFAVERPVWSPGDDLAGKSMLVVAEQGLGDEVLFSNVLEDVIRDLGPDGRLALAVERRLVPLFKRTFPDADVGEHLTVLFHGRTVRLVPHVEDKLDSFDLWAPMASLLRQYRRTLDAFPVRDRYLTPDPERIEHWRSVLAQAPAGRKVGLLWKSAIKAQGRDRYFSPFDAWAPVLKTPGLTFVNLQYGDCAEELEQARRDFGVEIWTPPGIDLKNDLDDLAALCCAMDLVLGFSNATFNIAAACGAPVWLVSTPGVWPRLGTRRYPWYPQARVFVLDTYGDWDPLMAEVAGALGEFAQGGTAAPPKG
ncbi:tetratricopeptide repeat protein [Phenylobacterium terrae]|uniref:Tetratricopeptide repeat protein n=1 Tax=Phenylobacterium terrae TaxID=2665495 RepID=A0ABW4N9D1_9CAUL